jgi:uncharacterized protein YjiS (DUF1127 family)
MSSAIRLGKNVVHLLSFREARSCLRLWRHRQQSRRQLLRLDEYLLRDIGLDRQGAIEEANKPFWRG